MMQLFSIWLGLADDDTECLYSYIKTLAQKYNTTPFPPHLTLYGELTIEQEKAQNILQTIAKTTSPFPIYTEKLAYEDHFFKTFYIQIKNSSGLAVLQEKLITGLGSPSNYIFSPHISLIYKEGMRDKQKKKEIGILTIKPQFTAQRLILATTTNLQKNWKDLSSWKKACEFNLI